MESTPISFHAVERVKTEIMYTKKIIDAATWMADDEPVDPKKYLEEACKPKCVKPLLEYQACVKRIQGDESGHKHCTGQYFDYWSCVDKCLRLFPGQDMPV
ncbi:hypothetical protein TIFTF001_028116 [Ficus carica]|uniref:Complex III subunit VI n=1 Tax=Ficus carica TaxID=3494 RepID=A0AA88IW17_FICCA|nr:hypothetical protein TIFTF001_028116 [Ficus carica]